MLIKNTYVLWENDPDITDKGVYLFETINKTWYQICKNLNRKPHGNQWTRILKAFISGW